MTFGISPAGNFPPPASTDFPQFIQFQNGGEDLGGPDADTLNFSTGLTATRGTGESSNVVTVTAEGGGNTFAWKYTAGPYTLEAEDANSGIAATTNFGNLTVPAYADVPFAEGTSVLIYASAAESTPNVVGADGVTINIRAGLSSTLAGRYSVASLINVAQDEWVLAGDLAAE